MEDENLQNENQKVTEEIGKDVQCPHSEALDKDMER